MRQRHVQIADIISYATNQAGDSDSEFRMWVYGGLTQGCLAAYAAFAVEFWAASSREEHPCP